MQRRLCFLMGAIVLVSMHTTLSSVHRIPPVSEPGDNGYVSGGLIYPLDKKPTPQCHASTIAETTSGLVAAWFGGTREGDSDVGIWVGCHDGQRWSTPVEVATGIESPEVRYPCWNPVLFQPRSGPLMLFYKVGGGPGGWWGMLMTSNDGGQTWSEPRKLGTGPLGYLVGPEKNKPIHLDDNSILCASSRRRRVHFELTRDLGKTWEVIGPIDDSQQLGGLQPSILTYADGKMQVLCRSRTSLTQSWSDDGGRTWSELSPTELPNPDAGTDAVTLRDGRQLLVYNHTIRLPEGSFPRGRDMLNVAISSDGRHWRPILTLECADVRYGYSYPAVVQAADDKVHITYTYMRESIKHVVLDPARVECYAGAKPRVIVSTDIGGSDPDDFQSMVHYLVYADRFETEGLISSPPQGGRAKHILECLAAYEKDYSNLRSWSSEYPTPEALRATVRQGAIDPQADDAPGSQISDGAKLIIERAHADDLRPVYVLVWGSLTDVAKAVHRDPTIKAKLRIYSIGSWNTRQDPKARNYLYENHPDLWWIESDTTFRGMYMGGDQHDDLNNRRFPEEHVKGHSHLGDLFMAKKADIKMSDTPSVLYLLHGDPDKPETESWGGAFVRPDPDRRPTYWYDDPREEYRDQERDGARTVSQWRKDYLRHWQERMNRARNSRTRS